jgi:hypothetical protein
MVSSSMIDSMASASNAPVKPNWWIGGLGKHLEAGNQVDVIVMDFAKAFDRVPHNRLLHKLDYYDIRGYTLT